MKRDGLNWLGVFAVCFVTFAGCSKKNAADAEKAHGDKQTAAKDTVHLTDENLKLVHIEVTPVTHGSWKVLLHAAGRVALNANQTAKVTSTFEGRITKMNHDLGDTVKQGDLMALIDSPELLNKPLELKAPMGGQVVDR